MTKKILHTTSLYPKNVIANNVSCYHLVLFLLLLPFDLFYSQVILISLTIHTILHVDKSHFQKFFTAKTILLTSIFLLSAIGIIWSSDKTQGIKEASRQLSILLFPFIFSTTTFNIEANRKKILLIFAAGCTITILILYVNALYILNYNNLPIKDLFSTSLINHNFSAAIGIHATYLSMYTSLSVAVVLCYFFDETKKGTRLLYAASILILLAGLVQLASRSVLIATIVFATIAFPFLILKGSSRWHFAIVALIIASFSILGITKIDSFKKRYVAELKDDLTQASVNNELLEPRIKRWQVAIALIKESPLIGYGSGTEKEVLKERYFEKKMYNSYLHQLNTHNQYLSFLLKTGILGLAVFLFVITTGFVTAIRSRNAIFLSFMILISIVSFSENILDVNKGILFFAFFYPFFMISSKPSGKLQRLI
jgi:O-antigen ligase